MNRPKPTPDPAGGPAGPAWWVAMACGFGYGVLTFLAFPPLAWWPVALLAPVPILWLGGRSGPRPLRAALWAAVGVVPFWLFQFQWLAAVTAVGFLPAVVHQSAWVFVTVFLIAIAGRSMPRLPMVVIGPVVWTGVEFFRGSLMWTGYAWFLAGHPLIDAPLAPLAASVLGAYAVSFLVVLVASSAVDLAPDRPRRRAAGAGGLAAAAAALFATAGLGAATSSTAGGAETDRPATVRIGVVQTNVPMDNKLHWTLDQRFADFERFLNLTRRAGGSDLIVWPETMFPGMALDARSLASEREAALEWIVPMPEGGQLRVPTTAMAEALLELQRQMGVPMLIGAIAMDNLRFHDDGRTWSSQTDANYNSVILLRDGRPADRYDKLHLTPFGETMPYISAIPALERALLAVGAGGIEFNLDTGPGPVRLSVPVGPGDESEVRVATPICFEAATPRVCQRLVFQRGARKADVMINVTNDGWFGWLDAGRRQHEQTARWRCAELATPMVRAANTGVSGAIDARGRLIRPESAPGPRAEGVLIVDVPLGRGSTVYARIGDVIGWLSLAGLVGLTVVPGIVRSRRRRRSDDARRGAAAAGE